MRNKKANKYKEPCVGSYPKTQVWTNGNFTVRRGVVQERIKLDGLNPIMNNYKIQVRQ